MWDTTIEKKVRNSSLKQIGNAVNLSLTFFAFSAFYQVVKNSNWRGLDFKDAGFVYESLQIKTNWVIWDFGLHKTNPRNESFKNESTKRIHDTNL